MEILVRYMFDKDEAGMNAPSKICKTEVYHGHVLNAAVESCSPPPGHVGDVVPPSGSSCSEMH